MSSPWSDRSGQTNILWRLSNEPLLEKIVDHLTERGVTSGARLPPERALAHDLGISRPALREATRALTGLGILEPRAGSGTYLADIDLDDLLAVRVRLEPLAAALAAERAADDQVARLQSIAASLTALVDDPTAFARADVALHATVAQASGNRFLTGSLEGLTVALQLSRSRTAHDLARRRATIDELTRLVKAVAARDPQAASAAMIEHLAGVKTTMDQLHDAPPSR